MRETAPTHHPGLAPLRALIEVTRLVREAPPLPELLHAVSATVAGSLGYATVTINLHRRAFDDFEVVAVHGSARARELLLGRRRVAADFDRLLDPVCERRPGAFFLPHESFDWAAAGDIPAYIPDIEVSDADTGAWHPEDALLLPLRHSDGHLLGVLSVDEPLSGRRPDDDELDVLAAVAQHAALAVQEAQESVAAARHRRALEELLQVSAQVAESLDAQATLDAVCAAVRSALGFDKVAVLLHDEETGVLEPRAGAGWPGDGLPSVVAPLHADAFGGILTGCALVEGCALLTREEVLAMTGDPVVSYPSRLNGRGPWAWQHHWLLVPLLDRDRRLLGVIWADDPVDRLLPEQPKLQALRAFANQAATALGAAEQFEQVRFLAEHDPLTALGNRRALVARLEQETERWRRHRRAFGLVLCDLNGFKQINDAHGHQAGDEALCAVAELLSAALRGADEAFRLGGDEFGLVLVETSEQQAREVGRRLTRALAASRDPRLRGLTMAFGVAVPSAEADDHEALLRHADETMYAAKRAARLRRAA